MVPGYDSRNRRRPSRCWNEPSRTRTGLHSLLSHGVLARCSGVEAWDSKGVPVSAMTAAFQSKHQIISQEVPYRRYIFGKLRINRKP